MCQDPLPHCGNILWSILCQRDSEAKLQGRSRLSCCFPDLWKHKALGRVRRLAGLALGVFLV